MAGSGTSYSMCGVEKATAINRQLREALRLDAPNHTSDSY